MTTALTDVIEQLDNIEDKTNERLDANMEKLMVNEVIPEIQSVARAANLPQKFIDGIDFVKTGKSRGKIVNTWGTKEKPLAAWFNHGTPRQIWVAPKNKKVLAFDIPPEGAQKYGHAIFFKSGQKGKAFSKGHFITGLPKTEAMEMGIMLAKRRLQQISEVQLNG